MTQDYSSQNLRGRSFRGQNLEGVNFSDADIRGADFTSAILIGVNFCHAKAGLQNSWVIFLLVISWLLSGLSGFSSAVSGLLVSYIFSHYSEYQIVGLVAIITQIIFFVVTIRSGIQTGFGTVTVVGSGAGAIVGAIIVAKVFAGAFAFAIAIAFAGAITFAIAFVFAVAFVFAIGVSIGVSVIKTFAVVSTVAFAIAVACALALFGVYIGYSNVEQVGFMTNNPGGISQNVSGGTMHGGMQAAQGNHNTQTQNQGDTTVSGDRTINISDGNYNEHIQGNYVQGNYYADLEKQSLTETAAEIQKLLEQLEKSYPTDTTAGKMVIATEAIQYIDSNHSLAERVLSALKAGGTQALAQFLNHPAASFMIGALEDWYKNH